MESVVPWDCVVIGAGAVGSSTAYHLAKQGKKVLVLEQFHLPHSRGSSHGQSRIIRLAYNDPVYSRLMSEAFQLWAQIEKEGGKTLFRETSVLSVEGGNCRKLTDVARAMAACNLPYEELTNDDIKKRYPMVKFPSDHKGILDKTGGMLFNDRCLAVLRDLIVKNGGTIRDGEKLQQILPGSVTSLLTNKGRYRAKKVVLTPGPWAKEVLLKVGIDLPLKTMPGMSLYWKDETGGSFEADNNCPIIIYEQNVTEGYRFIASFPALEYPGFAKVVTRGEPPDRYCHPDERDLDEKGHMINVVSEAVRQNYPGLRDKPSIVEAAVYTMTPDRGYIIDRHPLYTNIVFGVGFSGHGFKTAPVTGKLLAELVTERAPSYDIHPFRWSRFIEEPASKL